MKPLDSKSLRHLIFEFIKTLSPDEREIFMEMARSGKLERTFEDAMDQAMVRQVVTELAGEFVRRDLIQPLRHAAKSALSSAKKSPLLVSYTDVLHSATASKKLAFT